MGSPYHSAMRAEPAHQVCRHVVYQWDRYAASQANHQPFIENINLTKVQAMISLLDNCNEDSQEIDINEIVLSINQIWQNSADKMFYKRIAILSSENISFRKPVYNKSFNDTCKTSRNLYSRKKDAFRRNTLYVNKINLIRSSKIYNKSISAAKLKARRQFEHDLRALKSTDPRKYWKMLNIKSLKRNTIPVSMHEMVDHFKTLNEASTSDRTDNLHANIFNEEDNPELDYPFTEGEIRKVIKSLKCNKACGSDAVLNGFIISTVDIFLPIYIGLFDYILQSGKNPNDWVIGEIVPIYKNKGDVNSPGNYRGTTILSCFGKFFTSLLNQRLEQFLETHNILKENQIGFRKTYSTVDHVFSMKSLIDTGFF